MLLNRTCVSPQIACTITQYNVKVFHCITHFLTNLPYIQSQIDLCSFQSCDLLFLKSCLAFQNCPGINANIFYYLCVYYHSLYKILDFDTGIFREIFSYRVFPLYVFSLYARVERRQLFTCVISPVLS